MELIKENIEFEKLLGENFNDTIIHEEYIVPDTHPDISEILMINSKMKNIHKEMMKDKVHVNGEIDFTILYTTMEDEEEVVCSLNYTKAFTSSIEISGADREMICESECSIEHMECIILNSRKVCVEGVVNVKVEVSKMKNLDIVKAIDMGSDVQCAEKHMHMDKMIGMVNGDIAGETEILIPVHMPEIYEVMDCSVTFKSKEIVLHDDMVKFSCRACIKVLYRAMNTHELCVIENDIYLEKECELSGVSSMMAHLGKFTIKNITHMIKANEEGEMKCIFIDMIIGVFCKVMDVVSMNLIEDAYSPTMMLEMAKESVEMDVIHKVLKDELVVKGKIEIDDDMPRPKEILFTTGDICITEKRIVEDKILVEGVMKVSVLYKAHDKDHGYVFAVYEEIPFDHSMEVHGAKIHMHSILKASLDHIECDIEHDEIKIKGVIDLNCKVTYKTQKEFLMDVCEKEGEPPKKKGSFIIYVVQSEDTLWKVAKKYNTTIDLICKINDITEGDIKANTKLIIPGRAVI